VVRRPAPTTNAPAGFRLSSGFRLEVVASDPLLAAPIAMAFDERGRLFVLEGPDSGGSDPAAVPEGRVRVLTDADEEGVFQASTVLADHLPRASAIACYHGGVFVAAAPEILYLKDSRGDGVADIRVVAVTGLQVPGAQAGAIGLPNNFNWGLDHRIHAAGGGAVGSLVAPSVASAVPVAVDGADFAFDPRTLAVTIEAGPSLSGVTFDSAGRRYGGDPGHALRQPVYEPRYYLRNPYFAAPPPMADCAPAATRVFRWDSLKVGLRAADRAVGPGGLAPAWLEEARGCVVYRGGIFPSNYSDNVFVADPAGHLIHHLALHQTNWVMEARRPKEEQAVEFLTGADPAFRPWQIINGPEGALYVADRRVGAEEGRIYRIVPAGFRPAPPPRGDRLRTRDLVVALANTNGWMVDTAMRLLYEQQDPAAANWLSNMLANSKSPLVRLRALRAMDAVGALGIGPVARALGDSDPRVREEALLMLEVVSKSGFVPMGVWDSLAALSQDPSPRVRYQLALTLGVLQGPAKGAVLAAVLGRDLDNPWMRAAVLGALTEGAGTFVVRLAGHAGFRGLPGAWDWLQELGVMTGVRGRAGEVSEVLEWLERDPLPAVGTYDLLAVLGQGMHRTQSSLAMVDPAGNLLRFYRGAMLTTAAGSADRSTRLAAAHLLAVAPVSYNLASDWLRAALAPAEPAPLQAAALAALGGADDPRVTVDLLRGWPTMRGPLRTQAVGALLRRAERAGLVLDALQAGGIAADDFAPAQANFLRTHRDPLISARARQLLGNYAPERPAVVQRFRPAAALPGVAARGRVVFQQRCAGCHVLSGEGRAFGPDLDGVRIQGRERLLGAILEPGLEINPAFATTVMETRLGEVLAGIQGISTAATVTLREPGGPVSVWSAECIKTSSVQPWSLMPAGLEEGLELQDMADLLEYLTTAP